MNTKANLPYLLLTILLFQSSAFIGFSDANAVYTIDYLPPALGGATVLAVEQNVTVSMCAALCTRITFEAVKMSVILSDATAVFCGAYR